MTIQKYGNLLINGIPIKYEGAVKVEYGSIARIIYPQVNGSKIIVSDITSNKSKITVTIRNTSESISTFDTFYNNGDNNSIIFKDKNFTGCTMLVSPEREDLGTTDYVFEGDPAI